MKTSLLCCMICSLCGCALEPAAVSVDVAHVSHITQHPPFTAQPTDYGYGILPEVTVRWQQGRFHAQLSDGYAFKGNNGSPAPREVFTGSVGVDIWQH